MEMDHVHIYQVFMFIPEDKVGLLAYELITNAH